MINWIRNLDSAKEIARKSGKPILLQFRKENCSGCIKMNETTYKNVDVINQINNNFVPLKLDIIKDKEGRRTYPTFWTPSFYFVDYSGKLFYFIDGYLNTEDFLVILNIGYTRIMLTKGRYNEVFEILEQTIDSFPNNPSIPAIYMLKAQTHFLINRKRDEFLNMLNEISILFPNSLEARQID